LSKLPSPTTGKEQVLLAIVELCLNAENIDIEFFTIFLVKLFSLSAKNL